MSDINMAQVADPSTPSSTTNTLFMESTNRRPVVLDDKGVRNVVTSRALSNYLRNSGFWFFQRQAPGTLTTWSTTTTRVCAGADGWFVTNENASIQAIRVDTSAAAESGIQARYYGTFSKITNTGKIILTQMIEGSDTMPLRGRSVRFQVLMKASSAKTMKIAVLSNGSGATMDATAATFISAFGANGVDPTLGTNLTYLAPKTGVSGDNCTAGANAFTCSATTAWQRFGGVVDVPTTCKNLIVMVWTDNQFAAADSFSLSQASLTDGMEIQDWSPLAFGLEHARCLRYYVKTFPVDSNPAQSFGVAGALRFIVGIAAAVAGTWQWKFPVMMFKAPVTTTFYNPSAANAQVRGVAGATDATGTAAANGDAQGIDINWTGNAGWTVGQELKVHVTVDCDPV